MGNGKTIDVMQARLTRLQKLLSDYQELAHEDPQTAEYFLALITRIDLEMPSDSEPNKAETSEFASLWRDTHHDKILTLFLREENEWLSVTDIRTMTGIDRGAVANVLYSTHAEDFESKPHPHHAVMKQWRVVPHLFTEITEKAVSQLSDMRSNLKGGIHEELSEAVPAV